MIIETPLLYVFGLLGGLGLGIFYFGGLWFTVRKTPTSRNPHKLVLLSAVLRLGTTFLIFCLVGKDYPVIFLSMLPGFFAGRYFIIRRVEEIGRRNIHAA